MYQIDLISDGRMITTDGLKLIEMGVMMSPVSCPNSDQGA